MKPPKFEAVIFDMDGLMLDTERIAKRCWQQASLDFGYELPDDVFIQMVGTSSDRQILTTHFGENYPVAEIKARKFEYGDKHFAEEGIPLRAGLLELLETLDKIKLPKAIATSTKNAEAMKRLKITELLPRFSTIITGDQVENGKPAPDIYLKAAAALAIEPANCLVLEDSEPGIKAAHNAGMTPIMIPDLKQPSAEIATLAWKILPSLHEVRGLF